MIDNMDVGYFYVNGRLDRNRLSERHISDKMPVMYNAILQFISNIDYINFSQRIYHYMKNDRDYPYCENCGGLNKRWQSFTNGYKSGCCRSCAISLSRPSSLSVRRENTMLKYGVDHTSKLDSVKEKTKRTNNDKYGGPAPACDPIIMCKIKKTNLHRRGYEMPTQDPSVISSVKETNVNRYGVDNVMKSDVILNRVRNTNLERYGVTSYSKTTEFKEGIKYKNYERAVSKIDMDKFKITEISNNGDTMKLTCNCGEVCEIPKYLFYLRVNRYGVIPCLNCNPVGSASSNELDILKYIESKGIKAIHRYKNGGNEIDVFLPELNMGIEFNGVYWHSEIYRDKKYHYDKWKFFHDIGINVINVWEDDWNLQRLKVMSIIDTHIGIHDKVYARKCVLKKVSNKACEEFLNMNHLQGYVPSQLCYALYYEDVMVSVMTFSKKRHIKNSDWELVRFCNSLGISVVGGFSKLLNRFKKDNDFNNLVSYSSIDYFTGDIYTSNGFNMVSYTGPGYHWSKDGVRYNRYRFTKQKLVKDGFDKGMSESQIMYQRGYVKCWNCGNHKFELLGCLSDQSI